MPFSVDDCQPPDEQQLDFQRLSQKFTHYGAVWLIWRHVHSIWISGNWLKAMLEEKRKPVQKVQYTLLRQVCFVPLKFSRSFSWGFLTSDSCWKRNIHMHVVVLPSKKLISSPYIPPWTSVTSQGDNSCCVIMIIITKVFHRKEVSLIDDVYSSNGLRWLIKAKEAAWSAISLYCSKLVQRSWRLDARHLLSQSCTSPSTSIHLFAPTKHSKHLYFQLSNLR